MSSFLLLLFSPFFLRRRRQAPPFVKSLFQRNATVDKRGGAGTEDGTGHPYVSLFFSDREKKRERCSLADAASLCSSPRSPRRPLPHSPAALSLSLWYSLHPIPAIELSYLVSRSSLFSASVTFPPNPALRTREWIASSTPHPCSGATWGR